MKRTDADRGQPTDDAALSDIVAVTDGGTERRPGSAGGTEPDGGNEFSFGAAASASTVEVSRGERLRDVYTEFVYKPGLVAWDDRRTRLGALIMLVYVLMGTVGAWVYPAPTSNMVERNLQPLEAVALAEPSTWLNAPLGSTQSGVDVASMLIHATPEMLVMVSVGGVFATGLALVIGTVAGYKGGLTDRVLTTFSDVAMSIPGLPLIMVLAVVFRPESPALIGLLIMVNYWAGLGRSIRSQVLTLREEAYVEASRTMGVSTPRILLTDVVPNLMPYVLVNFANAARYVVFASVGLYYLGILPSSVANWGLQLDSAYRQAGALVGDGALYQLVVPMVAIMGLALALILLAQGLDRVFNPRVRTRLAGESRSTAGDGGDGDDGSDGAASTGVMT